MTIGERIKKIREYNGISQIDLANKVHITKQNLYKYENNIIINIPSDKIELIADALDVTPSMLMGWENKDKTTNQNNTLSKEEQRLIENFRTLSEQGKDYILQTMNMAINTYKKSDYTELQQEA